MARKLNPNEIKRDLKAQAAGNSTVSLRLWAQELETELASIAAEDVGPLSVELKTQLGERRVIATAELEAINEMLAERSNRG